MDTNVNGTGKFTNVNRFAPRNRFGAPVPAERVGAAGCGCGSCDRCKEASGKVAQPPPAPPPVAAPPPPPAYVAPPVGAGQQMRTMGAGNALLDAAWNNRTKGQKIAIGVGGGLAVFLLGWGIVAAFSGSSDSASEANEDGDADDALALAGLYQDPDRPCETLADVADALDVDLVDARAAAAVVDAPKLGRGYVLTREKAIEVAAMLEDMGAAEEPGDEDEDLDDEDLEEDVA